VSCGFSKQLLALHVEGDLSEARAEMASSHVRMCEDCRRFLDELRTTQSLLKSHRSETIRPSDCTPMRRAVMSIIEDRREGLGWALRIERTIMLGFGLRSYAFAAVGLLAIVSVSVLAHMRQTTPATSAAVFERGNTLVRPEGYRDWILVAPSSMPIRSGIGSAASATHTPTHRVYINPVGYREYEKTGRFPEGTLMIWESVSGGPDMAPHPHNESALLASVKDSTRFDGGWGFFNFTGIDGTVSARAQAVTESSGCGTCHRQDAETDHVFTQFYPVLQSARHSMQLRVPRDRGSLTELLAVPHSSAFPGPSLAVTS
jgi:Cytochrome P460